MTPLWVLIAYLVVGIIISEVSYRGKLRRDKVLGYLVLVLGWLPIALHVLLKQRRNREEAQRGPWSGEDK